MPEVEATDIDDAEEHRSRSTDEDGVNGEPQIEDAVPRVNLNAFLLDNDNDDDCEFDLVDEYYDDDLQTDNHVVEEIDELVEISEASDMPGVRAPQPVFPSDIRDDFELSSDSESTDLDDEERKEFILQSGEIESIKRYSRSNTMFDHVVYQCKGHHHRSNRKEMQSLKLRFLTGTLDKAQTKAAEQFRNGNSVIFIAPPGTGKSMLAYYATQTAIFSAKPCDRIVFVVADKIKSEFAFDRLKMTAIRNLELLNGEDEYRGLEPNDPICMVVTVAVFRYKLFSDEKFRKEIRAVVIDDVDQIADEEYGFLFEEVISYLPKRSVCCFTLNKYANLGEIMKYMVSCLNRSLHLVLRRERPRRIDRKVAMVTLEQTKIFHISSEKIFDWEEYEKAKSYLICSRKMADEKAFCRSIVEKSRSAAPIRETLREHFATTDCYPVMIVTYSVTECEEYALNLGNMSMFVDTEMQFNIMKAFERYMSIVGAHTLEEKRLNRMSRMLLNGVGYVHPGMPPTIREFVDYLYVQKYIQVLVVTEPVARHSRYRCNAVLFPSLRKFDGTRCRYVTNEEVQKVLCFERVKTTSFKPYNIIFLIHSPIPEEILKKIVVDSPMMLKFAYRPRLSTILLSPSYSFIQRMENSTFDSFKNPLSEEAEQELHTLILDYEEISRVEVKRSEEWCKLQTELKSLEAEYEKEKQSTDKIVRYLSTGRVVKVVHNGVEFGWGVVVRKWEDNCSVVYIAVNIRPDCIGHEFDLKRVCPHEADDPRSKIVQIVAFPVESVKAVSRFRVQMFRDLKLAENLNALATDLEELVHLQKGDVEVLEWEELAKIGRKIEKTKETLQGECFQSDQVEEQRLKTIEKLRDRIAELSKKRSESKEKFEVSAKSKVYKLNELLTQLGYRKNNANTEKGCRAMKCLVGDEIGLFEVLESIDRDLINANVESFASALLLVLELPTDVEAAKAEENSITTEFKSIIEKALKNFEDKLEGLDGKELAKQTRHLIRQTVRYDLLQGIYSTDYDGMILPDVGDKEYIWRRLGDYLRSYGISANFRRQLFSMLISCMLSTGDT